MLFMKYYKPTIKNRATVQSSEVMQDIWFSNWWYITPCSPLKVNGRFRGTRHIHLQGRRIPRARNQHEVGRKQNVLLAENSGLY
jgi:hypothetical protein